MSKRRRRLALAAVLIGIVVAVLVVTRRDFSVPNLKMPSDMSYSPAYRSQQTNPVFRNGRTQQRPPEGTVARGEFPLSFGPGPQDRARAATDLKNPLPADLESLDRGRQVFSYFCQHCHGPKGGGDGAVARRVTALSFPINSPSTYRLSDGEIFHIITYGRNQMPSHAMQISAVDRWKLIHYLRDVQREELHRLGPGAEAPEDPRRRSLVADSYGKDLFAQNCESCHGVEGVHPNPGVPTLHSASVLAVAGDAYYWSIITHGRSGTRMPAWKDSLTKTQIQSIVLHIRSWATPNPGRALPAGPTDAGRGRALFATHCIGCHGVNGRGGIGNSLSAPSFLAMASDQFLRDTIAAGRGHTAMPSSYDLRPEDISDLVAYIRSWAKTAPTWPEVQAAAKSASAKNGGVVFAKRCAGCHGKDGEGSIGSRLNSSSFLAMVDDEFLYKVIVQGRPNSEMPAWTFLSARELADVIASIRAWQKVPSIAMQDSPTHGRPEFGEVLYRQECVKCHGIAGDGDQGTQIGNPALLNQVSDDFLRRTIASGKQGTEMQGFMKRPRSPLGADDVDHLVAYLRRLQKNPPPQPLNRKYSWASAKDGLKAFEGKGGCVKCHGVGGVGASGPALGNPAFLKSATNGFLTGTIILGRENTPMHSYYDGEGTHLEEDDIENVVAYLRGLQDATFIPSRRVATSPEAVAAGRGLFRLNCARCHGESGEGRRVAGSAPAAPSLNNPEFLKAAGDEFLLATIALGRPGTPMPAFGDGMAGKAGLTADQIRQIVAFMRAWEKHR